jgi:hypothetical protein
MMPMTAMFLATAAFTVRSTLVQSNWFWTGSAPAHGTASHKRFPVGSQVCRDLEESCHTGRRRHRLEIGRRVIASRISHNIHELLESLVGNTQQNADHRLSQSSR